MGTTIPILVTTSPQGDKIWGSMSYAQLKSKKGLKDLSKKLVAIQKGEAEPPNNDGLLLRWNLEKRMGYGFDGKFVKLEGDKLHISNGKGKTRKVQLPTLCNPAISYAKMLAGQKEEKAIETAAPKEEDWTNAKGTVITATFLSLDGEQITLKLANGKETTFALQLLSKESRTRAKGYAK